MNNDIEEYNALITQLAKHSQQYALYKESAELEEWKIKEVRAKLEAIQRNKKTD